VWKNIIAHEIERNQRNDSDSSVTTHRKPQIDIQSAPIILDATNSFINRQGELPMAHKLTRPTPQSIASYAKKHAPAVRKAQKQHHTSSTSVREADYNGHHIVVTTTYSIEVDGIALMGHMGVANDGSVHYHPIPNMRFTSAIDLVKQVIDVFPDEFAVPKRGHRERSTKMAGMNGIGNKVMRTARVK
jgi:hypothetical protein